MKRTSIISLVFRASQQDRPFDVLETEFANISKTELSSSLLECGIIPESLEHDSSEEKLWAKYCDILLAHTLRYLQIPSEVLRARGDSADVFGRTRTYTIVGDAKAFRLSRTAKNQKDFKVKALDDWRRGNTYACLVSPLYQYPNRASQIYEQAIGHNVTLLSYMHIRFLLDKHARQDLSPLWNIGKSLERTKSALTYWGAVDHIVCKILGLGETELTRYKSQEVEKTKEIGEEGIGFWEQKITSYWKLSQREAVKRLIKAEKIEAKIKTIRNAILGLPEL